FGIRFLWGFQPLSPFFEEIPCFQKPTSSVFNPAKALRRQAFPSLSSKTRSLPFKPSLKTGALAPIEVEILLCRGSAQKIGADSGKQLLIIYCIKGFDFAQPDNLNFLLIYMYKNKPDRF
ncbi:MAG: hypothetical protein ACN6OI_17370, partial [Flavobacterium sp.]|uniref:hypothetical protein n=1 Tax=Flavobacterium sp. TaxID=239 RepID=UPI003D0E805A